MRVSDTAKLSLRGAFEDFLAYTYQSGSGGVLTGADRITQGHDWPVCHAG